MSYFVRVPRTTSALIGYKSFVLCFAFLPTKSNLLRRLLSTKGLLTGGISLRIFLTRLAVETANNASLMSFFLVFICVYIGCWLNPTTLKGNGSYLRKSTIAIVDKITEGGSLYSVFWMHCTKSCLQSWLAEKVSNL